MLYLAVWFLKYTRHFFGPSSYRLRSAVGHRAPPNECSANHMAEKKKQKQKQKKNKKKNHNIRFPELRRICVVADFPLDFLVVFNVTIIMIRLRYIIKSCQSFQTMLFSGLRNNSLKNLRIVGRVWNEGNRFLLCQRLPSPSTTTRRLMSQNLPILGLPALIRPPPIWRVLNKLRCECLPNNEALQGTILDR